MIVRSLSEAPSSAAKNKSKNTWSMLKWVSEGGVYYVYQMRSIELRSSLTLHFPFSPSLSRQFDRDKKLNQKHGEATAAGAGGLEEVLAAFTPSDFADEQLPRLCGLAFSDFVELVNMDRRGVVFWLSASHRRRLSDGDGKGTTPAVAPAVLPEPKAKSPPPVPPSRFSTAAAKEARKRSRPEAPRAADRLSEEAEDEEKEDGISELVHICQSNRWFLPSITLCNSGELQ